ncbi:MAG: acyltransferase [Gammaproteobacteria bacterium]|nr:MAG: acyltransferase [Gammaproteobacteria bacterium]
MLQTNIQTNGRACFFDNIRYLIVLLVIVLHVAAAYSNYMPYWVVDDQNSRFFDIMVSVLDLFLMSSLFFIAGYFALKSIQKTNCLNFIKNKFIRLGIPWLLGIVLLNPIHCYIYYYSRDAHSINIGNNFIREMKNALSFNTGFLSSTVNFQHYHLWFISLLLLFLIIFTLTYKGKQILTKNSAQEIKPNAPSNKRILLTFFIAGIIAIISSSFVFKAMYDATGGLGVRKWLIVGSVIQFQPIKISLYSTCFILGIYAFHKHWFSNNKAPGHPLVWLILSVIFYCINVVIFMKLMQGFSMNLTIILIIVRISIAFFMLLALISFGIKYWNSSSSINRSLADSSYNIYLFHLIFVYLIQLLLFKWEISIYTKFVIGCIGSILVSYLFSKFVLKNISKKFKPLIFKKSYDQKNNTSYLTANPE